MSLNLMYITNNPEVALIAEKHGVDRIWIDLEVLGKEDRQKNLNSVKSHHTVQDIKNIAPKLNKAELLVRINPWNIGSEKEISKVIAAGAQIVMLPMWKTVCEVKNFLAAVNGRVKTMLLLETKEAEYCLDEILKLKGIDYIHIGLNDLHLSYGLTFMFELLSNGTVESICNKIKSTGIPYGFGGVAKIGEGALPSEKIILEHYRLGSTSAILSRSFCDADKVKDLKKIEEIFDKNLAELRNFETYAEHADAETLNKNAESVAESVNRIVKVIEGRK